MIDPRPVVRRALPALGEALEVEVLEGGHLNHCFRVRGAGGSVVAKHAPPHVASAPELPLDPARQGFEAQALRLLGPGGALSDLSSEEARPPRLIFRDPDEHWILMEDLGALPDLRGALRRGPCREVGARLGRFIGRLHARSRATPELAGLTFNPSVQQTRLTLQYAPAAEFLARAGVPGAAALGAGLAELGRRLTRPGVCWVMGDLWPASVLCAGDGLRILDWELSTWGQPAQDLGHLMAHLRMLQHRAESAEAAAAAAAVGADFLAAYRAEAGPLGAAERADCALHFAAELLARSVGHFVEGGPYSGLGPEHPAVQEIVGVAVAHLMAPEGVGTFGGVG
ncbi:MAG: phosphotransferase [Alphaproteobacteria bacterium]|nr:phosphotransferase [Alphaproteobacteria bacterium]